MVGDSFGESFHREFSSEIAKLFFDLLRACVIGLNRNLTHIDSGNSTSPLR